MTAVVVVVAVLFVLLAAVAVPADRAAAAIAERRAGEFMTTQFAGPTTVRATRRPFVSQALRGRYTEVDVSGGGLQLGDLGGAQLQARLRNVHLPLRDLLARRVREVVCERVDGEVAVPYGELARVARIAGLELSFRDGTLLASAAVPVPVSLPGLSQVVRVSGEAVLTLNESRTVWLRVRGVSVVGITLPSFVLDQLLPALSVPIPLPELPFGLRLTELRPTADGLVAHGSADAVSFHGMARPVDPGMQDARPVR